MDINNTTKHPYSDDRPIKSRKEDLLGRTNFAGKIADGISKWKQKDSLIIAVYGDWGNGKSSVKNMLIEFLREKNPQAVNPIEFNPWEWQEQRAIAEELFYQIQTELSSSSNKEKNKKINEAIRTLRKYWYRLRIIKAIIHPFSILAKWIFTLLGGIGTIVSFLILRNGYSGLFWIIPVSIFIIICKSLESPKFSRQ